MAGLLDQKQQAPAPQVDPNMSTEGLYSQAKQQEAGFVQTAPKGYLDPNEKINPPPGAGEGWLKGYLMRQENNRANAELGMKQEVVGWNRTDREKKRMIDDGMVTAAQKGGYTGVIDYLESVDPDRAIEFTNAKLKLDENIMKNSVMKSLLPAQKAEAMLEGYGVLGKMGTALLNADPKDRESMYQTMLPMIKTVNPNASEKLDSSAVSMFMLGAAQATPENVLFANRKDQNMLRGKVGNAIAGKNYLLSKGYSPDSPEVKAFDAVLGQGNVELERLEVQKAKLQLSQQQNVQNKISTASKALTKINNDFIDATNTNNNFMSLYNDPARGTEAFGSAVTQTLRASGEKGTISDADKRPLNEGAGLAATGLMELRKQVGLPGGGTAQQWDNLKNIQQGYYESTAKAYEIKLATWEKTMRAQGVPEEEIQSLLASTKVTGAKQIQQNAPLTPDALTAKYQSMVQKVGNDPQKQQLLKQAYEADLKDLKLKVGQE